MTDKNKFVPEDNDSPIRQKSSGFISRIHNWTKESLVNKIIVYGLSASLALGGIYSVKYSVKKCFKSDVNTDAKQTFVQKTKNLVQPVMPNTVKECEAYFPNNNSTKILNQDEFEKCLDTLSKNGEVYVNGFANVLGSVRHNLNLSDKRADSDPLEEIVKAHGFTIKESKGYGETDKFGDLEKNRVAVVSVNPLGYEINADNEIGGKGKFHKKHKRVAKAPINYNQCGDGFDNDGDTFVDMKDAGCNSILDNNELPFGKPPVDDTDDGDKDNKPGEDKTDDGDKNPLVPPVLDGDNGGNKINNNQITDYPIKIDVKENMPVEFRVPNSYLERNPNAKFSITAYDGEQPVKTLDTFDNTTIDKDMKYQSKENFPQSNTEKPYKYLIGIDNDGDGKLDSIDAGDDAVPDVLRKQLENNKDAPIKVDPNFELKKDEPRGNNRNDLYQKSIQKSCKQNPAYCKDNRPKEINQNDYLKDKGSFYIAPGVGLPKEILASMMFTYVDGTEVASLDVNHTLAFTAEKNRDKIFKEDKNGKKEDLECKTKNVNLSWERDGWVNKKGSFDNANEISGKPGTYVIKADEKVDYKVVDNNGVNISYQRKGNDIVFDMPKDVQSVKINTVYKENKKDCAKKDIVIKNNKFKAKTIGEDKGPKNPKEGFAEDIKKAAEKTGVFAGITTGSYDESYKNNSTDITYKGDSQTIGAGIVIKPTENVKITPYVTQTEIKADVIDTATKDDFAKVESENLTVGLNTEFKVGKKNTPFENTKIELEADYTKTDSKVDYTNFDIHAKKTQNGFIGIGDVEMPKLFPFTNNVDMGLGFRAVYSQEDGRMIDDSPAPDNTSFKLTKGLYSGKLLFNIDMDNFFIPDNMSFDLRYRTIDDIESKETLKGMSLRNMLYFEGGKRIKTYAELFGEFPINGNLEQTNYGAILGWDKLSDHGPLKYLGFEFEGGARKLEKNTSISKDITNENYFTAGIKINTDNVLKLLKDPFNR